LGGIVRAVLAPAPGDELEVSARWYGVDFANPYARALAAPDEVDGLRSRDERGARVRYATALGPVEVRTSVDVWRTTIPAPRWQLAALARGDVPVSPSTTLGVWLEHKDKHLGHGGRGQCYEVATEVEGEVVPCAGQ